MLGIMVSIIVALLIAPAHARDWKQDAQDDIKAFRNAPAPAPAPPATAAQPAQPKQSSERQEAEKRAATAKFPSSNSEKGCLALMTAISTRIETVFSLNGEKCSELKNKFQGKSD